MKCASCDEKATHQARDTFGIMDPNPAYLCGHHARSWRMKLATRKRMQITKLFLRPAIEETQL